VEPKAAGSSSIEKNGSCSNGTSSEPKTFEIYQSTTSDQGFKDYHERLQFWIMFYIDAASYIDIDDDFIRLRDFVDVQNALKRLDCFSCFEKVRTGFNSGMVEEARDQMKLGKKQTRRVYEIIRLYWTKKAGPLNDTNTEYKNYRVDVKKRLNIPFQKEKNQMAKLKKALKPEEFAAATLTMTNREQRLESLQAQYNELLDHYKQILERISASPS